MINNGKNNNKVFCSHINKSNSIKNKNKNELYDYCPQCGSISIKNNNHFYYTIKPIIKQKEIEIDPVIIVKEMIKYQNKNKPYLNNVFNLNLNDKASNLTDIKERIFLYLSKRKLLLLYLQTLTKVLNYSDLSFYQCLLLTDLYLSHNISKKMTDEELLYILIGFFLIASKFKETDIFEPELYIFCNIDFDYALTVEKILFYEAKCLKLIKYDFFIYSTYDWLNTFMGNGYIFEGEINENENEEINEIHSYSFKLLITITPKNIFIKYSPIHNAISIVQICREDKIDKNKINNELFNKLLNIYGIKFQDYENCYYEIKETINKYNSDKNNQNSNHNNQIRTLKRTENNKTLNEINYENNENKVGIININRSGKKIIKFDTQRKLNLKQKLRDNKLQINLFSSNIKQKKRFKSINLTNNNSSSKNNGIMQKQKTLQIVEYINENLPKIKNLGGEGDKVYQTETEITSGRNIKVLTIKNDILNNYLKKNNKNKSGTSLDVKLFYNNGKSSFGFNRLLRNITYDALKNNEGKISKKLIKNNTNLAANQNKSKILNKSSDALKYCNTNENTNIKNNNNIILELKNTTENNKKSNNSNLNIYKTNSNIYNYNNGKKNCAKQNKSEYLKANSNNIKIIKPEKSSLNNNNKNNEMEIYTNKEGKENKKSSIEKNKDKFINDKIINNIINKKNKFILSNMKYNKSNLKNLNDLLSLKKLLFKNQKFPKLKLKIDK